MAEYYSLLKKAVAGLDASAVDVRKSVYDRARNALISQLKGITPPLSTAEISRQRLELEEAIRRVEREAALPPPRDPRADAINAATRAMEAAITPPASTGRIAPRPSTPPAGRADGDADGAQAIFRRAMQDAADRHNRPIPPARPIFPTRQPEAQAIRPPPMPLEPPVADPFFDGPQHPVAGSRLPDFRAASPLLSPDPGIDEIADIAPPSGPAGRPPDGPDRDGYVDSWPEDVPPAAAEPAPGRRGRKAAAKAPPPPPRDYADGTVRPSRLPSIIITVLVVAMVGAVAAVGWTYRSDLADFIASFTGGEATTARPAAPAPPAPPATIIAANTPANAPAPGPERVAARPAPDTPVRVVGAAPPSPEVPVNPEAREAVAAAPPAEVVPPAAAAGAAPAEPALAIADPQQPAVLPVAQRATLFEEPIGGAAEVATMQGAVTWSFVPGGVEGPQVEAVVDVPERQAKVRIAIRKDSFPATHLIEIIIEAPAEAIGGGVQSIPSIVMKPSEEARGTQLAGQAVKITENVFWIALTATDNAAVANNTAMLRDQTWFDLPLLYANGQRAILTFEKGGPGEAAFTEALAAWAG